MKDIKSVVLDANVLYPAPLRDFLLSLAFRQLFMPKWSDIIQYEWTSNLLLNRTDLTENQLNRTVKLMNTAFPEANVEDFEHLTNELELPDENDRHVLAVAIASKSNIIITQNLKDFPDTYLHTFQIEALSPDDFILNLIKEQQELVLLALKDMQNRLKNPPLSILEILETLQRNGLKGTVLQLKGILEN